MAQAVLVAQITVAHPQVTILFLVQLRLLAAVEEAALRAVMVDLAAVAVDMAPPLAVLVTPLRFSRLKETMVVLVVLVSRQGAVAVEQVLVEAVRLTETALLAVTVRHRPYRVRLLLTLAVVVAVHLALLLRRVERAAAVRAEGILLRHLTGRTVL